MLNKGPKPAKTASKAIIVHSLAVQAAVTTQRRFEDFVIAKRLVGQRRVVPGKPGKQSPKLPEMQEWGGDM